MKSMKFEGTMKPLQGKRCIASPLIAVTMFWLLVSLAACTPAAIPSSGVANPATAATANPDQGAADARKTIEAALLAEPTATVPAVATPTLVVAQAANEASAAATASMTPTMQVLPAMIAILIVTAPPVAAFVEQEAPPATATPDMAATKKAEDQRVAIALAATQTAQPTATPDLDATATAEAKRIAMLVAEILTAQPTATATATATPDLAATATADMKRINMIVAATLTAQPTITPTGTPTWTPTATPDFASTATANAQAMATSVAATLTAQPTATARPTETPTLTATWTPTPDFRPLLVDYRRAERAALQSLDVTVLAQLPVFASGEALDIINGQVEALRAAGQYQILLVEEIQIVQVMLGPTIGVLTRERHTEQTFAHTTDGDRLVAQATTTLSVVYGLINEDGRWKINRVRNVQTE